MGFYPTPSSAVCFSLFSFCLTYCVWVLLFIGCRFIVPVVFGVCSHWLRLVQWVVRLPGGGSGACVLVDEPGSCLSGGLDHFWWCVLGCLWHHCDNHYYDFRQPLSNRWCCVPVFLVVLHMVSSNVACWSFSAAGFSRWDGDLWENFHRLILCGTGRCLVDQCPELSSPTSETQAWRLAGAPRPCQPHGSEEKWEKRKKEEKIK